jgi:hypothetical protein
MKPRTKFIIGAIAAITTFGTLAATVGHQRHHGRCDNHQCHAEQSTPEVNQP